MQKRITQIKKRIETIQRQLTKIEEMRPGSLTKQYQKPQDKKGGFYQLSYTYKMKSKTEYIRPEFVKGIKKEIVNYKKFKTLTQEWVDLAIEHSKLKMKIEKEMKL